MGGQKSSRNQGVPHKYCCWGEGSQISGMGFLTISWGSSQISWGNSQISWCNSQISGKFTNFRKTYIFQENLQISGKLTNFKGNSQISGDT